MDEKKDLPVEVKSGRAIVDPTKLAEFREIEKRDAQTILEQNGPDIVAALSEELSQELRSNDPSVRREARALGIQLLPFIAQKKGIQQEAKKKKGGGISDELARRLNALTEREIIPRLQSGSS